MSHIVPQSGLLYSKREKTALHTKEEKYHRRSNTVEVSNKEKFPLEKLGKRGRN